MVGIELGCACCRRGFTTLVLSVARWVHNSAMATFSEAPLSFRTAGFPRSGWKSWSLVGEPSHPRRGSSAGSHTPRRAQFTRHFVPSPTSAFPSSVSGHHADHGTTKYPESLCLISALPLSGRRNSPPARTLLPGPGSYGLMRQSCPAPLDFSLRLVRGVSAGCYQSLLPAGPSRRYLCESAPIPAVRGVHLPVSSSTPSAFPRTLSRSALPQLPVKTIS
jgi:hypothetical protein